MDEQKRLYYLQTMETQVWLSREQKGASEPEIMPKNDRLAAIAQMDWDQLQTAVAQCQACELYKTRTQTVFGVGDRHAELLIIGEAPGANEDRQGEPFVGRAGRLLNSMLQAIGLERAQVYIANVVKSRPPNNRDPLPEEVAACIPFLQRQIALLQPKLILTVGKVAAHHVLKSNEAMANLRGHSFSYGDTEIPVIVTYHPAYLLRAPREKRKAWTDMQRVKQFLGVKQ